LSANGPTVSGNTAGITAGDISLANNAASGKNITVSGSLTANGSSASGSGNHNAGNGGAVTVDGTGTVALGAVSSSGGTAVGTGNGGNAGAISVTGDSGLTLNDNIGSRPGAGSPTGNQGTLTLTATTSGGVNQTAGSLDLDTLVLAGNGTFNLNQVG